MNSLSLVDGSHLLHRVAFTSVAELENGFLHGFLRSLQAYLKRNQGTAIVVLWDMGKSKFRQSIDSEYKSWKEEPDEDTAKRIAEYTRSRAILNTMLSEFGIPSLLIDSFEADDLIFFFREFIAADKYIILTEDMDLWQLIDEKTVVYRPIREEWVDKEALLDKFDLIDGPKYIEQYIAIKAMVGDKSDNISGIDGIGNVNAARITKALLEGSFEPKRKVDQAYIDNVDVVRQNVKLIDIGYLVESEWNKILPYAEASLKGIGRAQFLQAHKVLMKYKLVDVSKEMDLLLNQGDYYWRTLNKKTARYKLQRDYQWLFKF